MTLLLFIAAYLVVMAMFIMTVTPEPPTPVPHYATGGAHPGASAGLWQTEARGGEMIVPGAPAPDTGEIPHDAMAYIDEEGKVRVYREEVDDRLKKMTEGGILDMFNAGGKILRDSTMLLDQAQQHNRRPGLNDVVVED
jgi:hypothetical protein